MKRPPAQNTSWTFVLDTEHGPEGRYWAVDAPTQEKAEELVAEEFGIDVLIVSINGKLVNRRPTYGISGLLDEPFPARDCLGSCLPVPAESVKEVKKNEDNIVVAPYMMLPCATEAKGWG